MWDVLTDGLEKLVDELRERWPRAMFWTVVVLWSGAAALPTIGAALTGAGWFSVLIPLAPLFVITLTYLGGVEWIPTPAWVSALTLWAILPGGLAYAKTKGGAAQAGVAVFLFCYGQLLVALLRAICVRRGYPLQSPFAQLRLVRLRLVAAAFPLAVSFRADAGAPDPTHGWHNFAVPIVTMATLVACAFPSRRKALVAAIVVAAGAWGVVAHSDAHDRWAQIGENGWIWLSGCYQWFRASRKDYWRRGLPRGGRLRAAARQGSQAAAQAGGP